jgi:hypothetical protein
MTLQFPTRLAWVIIALFVIYLLQSGCQPIQPPADVQAPASSEEGARPAMSTTESEQSISPDGLWTATSLLQIPRSSEEYYQSLVVAHTSGSPSYTLVDGESPLALGYTVAKPLAWSEDSERFYYTNRPQADGCGLLYNGSDLYRVYLATGETEELLPANTTTTLGLSPDEQRVVYLTTGKPTLNIHDLMTDEVINFDLAEAVGDGQTGAFVWSPFSEAIALVVAHNPCFGGWAVATSIYILNLETMNLAPVIEQDERLLMPTAWASQSELLAETPAGEAFTIDLATNTVTPALTSTGTPAVTTPITATGTISQ